MCTRLTFILVFPSISGQITMCDEKLEPVDLTGIRFSFHMRGDTDQLNGQFTVEHRDCSKKYCGQKLFSPPISDGDQIQIRTELSPCSDHLGIKIKAGKFDFADGGVVVFRRDWKALICNKLSDTQISKPAENKETHPNANIQNNTHDSALSVMSNHRNNSNTAVESAHIQNNHSDDSLQKMHSNNGITTNNRSSVQILNNSNDSVDAAANKTKKENISETILVAVIASITTLVLTLTIVFAILAVRTRWRKKALVKVENNNYYGVYYG